MGQQKGSENQGAGDEYPADTLGLEADEMRRLGYHVVDLVIEHLRTKPTSRRSRPARRQLCGRSWGRCSRWAEQSRSRPSICSPAWRLFISKTAITHAILLVFRPLRHSPASWAIGWAWVLTP